MAHYEIRILRKDLNPSLMIEGDYESDDAAVSYARRCAGIHPVDVWRDLVCIYCQLGNADVSSAEALKIASQFLRNDNLSGAAYWSSVAANRGLRQAQ